MSYLASGKVNPFPSSSVTYVCCPPRQIRYESLVVVVEDARLYDVHNESAFGRGLTINFGDHQA